MIVHLSDEDQEHTTKDTVCDMEYDIVTRFGWDFNFQNPITFIERYLPYVETDIDKTEMKDMAIDYCKQCLHSPIFLDYRSSVQGACALILAHNVAKQN